MKSKKNLILVGMMGSGKSTIGALIGKKLNLKFFDTDQLIEDKMDMDVSDIFEKKGEKFFRKLEETITTNLLNASGNIISLGGGAFINERIRKEVNLKSISFWLNCDIAKLIFRIRKNTRRPLALELNNHELKKLIIKRSKIYGKAKYKIECKRLNKNKIVNKIIELYDI